MTLMQEINKIPISAYLNPDPLDEDAYVEEEWISWIPGYSTGDNEEGLPSYLKDENIALFERIETFTSDLFKKAVERMWPLLKEYYFKQIYIGIDYTNSFNSSALAGYNWHFSNPATGYYYFTVNQKLLTKYVSYLHEKITQLPNLNLWEHELIHLLDHRELMRASILKESDLTLNNLHYYILKYREEGIANLLDLLDGKIKDVTSIEEAKSLFSKKVAAAKNKLFTVEKSTDQIRNDIYSGYDFYEVGPWIVLEMLGELPMVTELIEIEDLEEKIIKGESIEESLKLEIIKNAFHIDSTWFLNSTDVSKLINNH